MLMPVLGPPVEDISVAVYTAVPLSGTSLTSSRKPILSAFGAKFGPRLQQLPMAAESGGKVMLAKFWALAICGSRPTGWLLLTRSGILF